MKTILLLCSLALCIFAQPKPVLKLTVEPKADVKADVEVPFQVTVRDSKGAAVDGAQVEVIATMVEMDHGEFKYEARESKRGVYEFSPKFLMGGAWNLAVKAKKGSAEGAVSRKIEVKD